MIHSTEVTAE